MFWGNWTIDEKQSADNEGLLSSEITKYTNVTKRSDVPIYYFYKTHWRNDAEIQQHYWTASFLLPLGSIFILALVVVLMVLFKRCPHIVAAIVAGILGIILVFVTLISLNHPPTYS
ncbi:uncharacterized protein LOC122514575 [Polistes fuscatus]|uniref:uncharacterized protein LOC122514575 n=1 Tax=Polistes fuscatus TaxID=30207 RepID=UPI001CA87BD7|nr:uncharacterized protein LOC122514575 [Polistes fuscatus]